ncbi:MAG: AEC family transporter [Chloroflexaceae bacterium]|nr:AEC family transporter [Chloroflexaceae bacterium]
MGELLSIFLNVVAPVFMLVIIGYIAGPRLELDPRSLSRVAYSVLTPAFVFNTLYRTEIELALALRMMAFIIVVELGCAIVAIVVARFLKRPAKMIAAYVLIAVFGNVGNFGFPIIQFALGEEALGAATIYFLTILVLSFIIGVAVANWQRGGSAGAALAVIKTPALWAVPPAVLLQWLQFELPAIAIRPVELLAGALIPTMLLTLGVILAQSGIPRRLDTWVASAIRLLVGPILAVLLVTPFALTGVERGTGIMQASMPTAILASIIATENDLLPTFVISTVLFSTLASVVTLTLVITFFVPRV